MAASRVPTFTVASGGTDSNQLDLQIVNPGQELVGFVIPGTIISTAMTFKVSADGSTFVALKNEAGAAVSVTVASATAVGLKQDIRAQLARWRYVQAIMGSTETNGATIIPVVL